MLSKKLQEQLTAIHSRGKTKSKIEIAVATMVRNIEEGFEDMRKRMSSMTREELTSGIIRSMQQEYLKEISTEYPTLEDYVNAKSGRLFAKRIVGGAGLTLDKTDREYCTVRALDHVRTLYSDSTLYEDHLFVLSQYGVNDWVLIGDNCYHFEGSEGKGKLELIRYSKVINPFELHQWLSTHMAIHPHVKIDSVELHIDNWDVDLSKSSMPFNLPFGKNGTLIIKFLPHPAIEQLVNEHVLKAGVNYSKEHESLVIRVLCTEKLRAVMQAFHSMANKVVYSIV